MYQPDEYRLIAAWGTMMSSFQYYIKNEQEKASDQNAPLNSVYYDIDANKWVTYDDITSTETKDKLNEILQDRLKRTRTVNDGRS